MQIAPLGAMPLADTAGSSYASASTAASSARFDQMLHEVQAKASSATATHIVNEASSTKQEKELKEACKGFEAMFLSMMYKEMRKTVPENTLFGKSNAEKIFEDMRDSEMMKNIADGGGVGLADMMYRQLSPQLLAKEHIAQRSK